MRLIGLDPGGANQFGWSVIEGESSLPVRVVAAGTSSSAEQAVGAVRDALGPRKEADGAGIDSPLFWVPDGERHVDRLVREAIKRAGAPNAGGTVQQVNSLRGACIVQGVLAAHLLRGLFPGIRITESHPKALLWLIDIASSKVPAAAVGLAHLSAFLRWELPLRTEHERDAALGALAAWSMVSAAPGWRNLAPADQEAFAPVPPVEYWMPIQTT